MKKWFRKLVDTVVLLALVAVVVTVVTKHLERDAKVHEIFARGLSDSGVSFTCQLRAFREKQQNCTDDFQCADFAKDAVMLLAANYDDIFLREGWLRNAINCDLIRWSVLLKHEPVIADEVKEMAFSSARNTLKHLRSNVPWEYDKCFNTVMTCIVLPVRRGMLTWEEVGSSEEEVKSCLESKKGHARSDA